MGLPNNALADLMIGSDGYLWLATLAGTQRFDGVRFTPILESLPNSHARVLLEDHSGNIWVGMDGAGLVRYKNGRLESFPLAQLAGVAVRRLAEDSRGRIWEGTDNGITVIDSGRIQFLRTEQGLPGNQVRGLARGHGAGENSIWIATDQGLCEARNLILRCVSQQQLESSGGKRLGLTQPSALVQDRNGRLWIGRTNTVAPERRSLSAQTSGRATRASN
jgi:ligand-binding sensor domain-containing protein